MYTNLEYRYKQLQKNLNPLSEHFKTDACSVIKEVLLILDGIINLYHLVREINHQVNNLAGDLLSKARPVGPTHH
jgi:hypothetical protein